MSRATPLAVVTMSLVMAACSNSDEPAAPDAGAESSVFDPLTQTLDRARDVEVQVDQRMDELDKRLEEAEGQ